MDQCSGAPTRRADITEQTGAPLALIDVDVNRNDGRAQWQLIPATQHLTAKDLSINYPHFPLTYNQSVEQTHSMVVFMLKAIIERKYSPQYLMTVDIQGDDAG